MRFPKEDETASLDVIKMQLAIPMKAYLTLHSLIIPNNKQHKQRYSRSCRCSINPHRALKMVSAFRFIDFFSIAEKMSTPSPLEQQLNNFTRALREQGIIDSHFDDIKELESQTPCLVMDAITMFLRDADIAIAEVMQYLGAPLIHYPRITEISYQLKGSSSSIGGCQMASACCELRDASEANDKERSLTGFDRVRREYLVLRENLTLILQMERAINAMNPRRRFR